MRPRDNAISSRSEDSDAATEPTRYWEERLAAQWTLGSVGWLGLGEAYNRWMYEIRGVVFRRSVRTVVRPVPGDRILDVASGTGFYVEQWRELGLHHVEASDLTETATRRLRERFRDARVHRFDVTDRGRLPGDSFDAVSAMDVLFHLVDDSAYERAVSNLSDLVRPGGHVVLTENLADARRRLGPTQVLRAREEVEDVLAKAGLAAVLEVPMFVLMNAPIASNSRVLEHWWWLVSHLVRVHEVIGWATGAALLPAERGLLRVVRRPPSTSLLVCRRI